jgi:RND family efflux transporter MFP subunit
MRALVTAAMLLALTSIQTAGAESIFVVAPVSMPDQKAVFATVESRRIVPARARIGGTVAALAVKEGDQVELGQVVATVVDEKLTLQLQSLDAQIAALQAQLAQAQIDLDRAEALFKQGAGTRAALDQARTGFNVTSNGLKARTAERAVVQEQLNQGAVLAPAAGRVLRVPLTTGTVVMAGETVADIAERNFVLRLRVPERHARFLKAGDTIRVDAAEFGEAEPRFGKITLVYPRIEDGRVVADAEVEGLGDYFVNERIRVWVSAGERTTFIVPESFITTRFGVDYVAVRSAGGAGGADIDVPVQRGRELPRPDLPDGIEILSGLKAGDRLVKP